MAHSPSRIMVDSLISPIAAIESLGLGFSAGVHSNKAVARPAPRDRLPSTAADGRTSVNRFGPRTPTPKPTPKPTYKPTSSRQATKDLAYFMAEAKKKGKTGKGVGNYAYTMFKDYKMRTNSDYSGPRITGTKPRKREGR